MEKIGAYDVIDRNDDTNVIYSTWDFKLKKFPDGLRKKHKDNYSARGDHQL